MKSMRIDESIQVLFVYEQASVSNSLAFTGWKLNIWKKTAKDIFAHRPIAHRNIVCGKVRELLECFFDSIICFNDNNHMALLDFLVTSDTRKDLLHLLWGENAEASGHQLSQLVRRTYSAVHSELEAMKEEGLVTSREEGRAKVFRKNDQYPSSEALKSLLGPARRPLILG